MEPMWWASWHLIKGGKGKKSQEFKASLSYIVWSQPGLHEILFQTNKNKFGIPVLYIIKNKSAFVSACFAGVCLFVYLRQSLVPETDFELLIFLPLPLQASAIILD